MGRGIEFCLLPAIMLLSSTVAYQRTQSRIPYLCQYCLSVWCVSLCQDPAAECWLRTTRQHVPVFRYAPWFPIFMLTVQKEVYLRYETYVSVAEFGLL
jgi:hypothetical protein